MMITILFASILAFLPPDTEGYSEPAKAAAIKLEEIRKAEQSLQQTGARLSGLQRQHQMAARMGRTDEIQRIQEEFNQLRGEYDLKRGNLLRQIEEFLKELDASVDAAPEDWSLRSVRGEVRMFKGDSEGAQEDLRKVLETKPDHDTSRTRLIQLLHVLNRYEEALDIIKGASEAARSKTELAYFQGSCLFAVGRFDEAEKILIQIRDRKDDDARRLQPMIQNTLRFLPAVRTNWKREAELRRKEAEANDLPHVRLTTSRGDILLELFENEAPNTVANFISLVEKGFYDGIKFHRVIPNFMVQGGCPNSKDDNPANDGQGGPGYTIADELPKGAFRTHFRGTLSMAKTAMPNTGGSQFFLCHQPTPWLDGKHAVFGRVIEGQPLVDAMQMGDVLEKAEVVRKRDHAYEPETRR